MNNKTKKRLFLSLDIFLFLLIFLLASYLVFEKTFDNKIYPNIYIADINLSGLSPEQAKIILENKIIKFEKDGLNISLNNKKIIWHNFVFSINEDSELASVPVIFNLEKSVNQAFLIGRSNFISDFIIKFKSLFFRTDIALDFILDKSEMYVFLEQNFSELDNPSYDARLDFKQDIFEIGSDEISFFIVDENFGEELDFNKFFNNLNARLSFLNNSPINLSLTGKEPLIKKSNSKNLDKEAEELLNLAPFDLFYGQKKISVDKLELASWFELSLRLNNNNEDFPEVKISINKERVFLFFDEKVKNEINQDSVLPKFEFSEDRVSFFEPGKDGLYLDYEGSFSAIGNYLINKEDTKSIELVVEVSKVENSEDLNDLGVREIIGVGHSNFAGSSSNRRHNIKVGASKLHGLIIKPGDEFSLVTALGKVDKNSGYLPELVIKGNKTIPEYGGGLCQIATTIFRAALGTGLPITERRNHSYRVSYYEPAGTDATIYSPRPDLKFKNDTNNNIIIQARFEGQNDIYFDFWGKSDGRLASTSYPVIYNIVRPGPTQIIETTDLAPGEKKCTEKAHSGAEAYFDYVVIYNNGLENENKVENRFYSKYVAWREVCLVGVKPAEVVDVVEDSSNKTEEEKNIQPIVE